MRRFTLEQGLGEPLPCLKVLSTPVSMAANLLPNTYVRILIRLDCSALLPLRFALRSFYLLVCSCSRPTLMFPFIFLYYHLQMFLVLWSKSVQTIIFLAFVCTYRPADKSRRLPFRHVHGFASVASTSSFFPFSCLKVHPTTIESRVCSASFPLLELVDSVPYLREEKSFDDLETRPENGTVIGGEALFFAVSLCVRMTVTDFELYSFSDFSPSLPPLARIEPDTQPIERANRLTSTHFFFFHPLV